MKTSAISIVLVLLAAQAASASIIRYNAFLTGPGESPPTTSPGTGTGSVIIDTTLNTMTLHLDFTGLTSPTTASHLHCCTPAANTGTAGVATTTPTFAGFPLGVTSGTFNSVLDLTQTSSWNPAFITANGGTTAGAEAALLAGIAAGETYWNVHTSANPGGEIRGFLVATPEPATMALVAGALLGFGLIRRRRKP